MRRRAALIAALAIAAAGALPSGAAGAGVVTHGLMAERAVAHVASPELAALLRANRSSLLSGAAFPDGGYAAQGFPGSNYSEISHWQRFVDGYAAHVRAKQGCGALAAPTGPCAALVAHLMGVAAHGMGDETWDWLFEPRVTDHHEDPTHPSCATGGGQVNGLPPCSLIDNIEYAMDVVAIVDHARWEDTGLDPPPFDDLLAVYRSIGRPDVTREGLVAGHGALTFAAAGERAGAAADSQRVRAQMPWSASHYTTEAGGIDWSARAIARYLDAVWVKLTGPAGSNPPLRLAAVHPAPGDLTVETTWQPPRTSPGPRTGGGRLRVLAVLSNSLDARTVTPASFRLLDARGEDVAPLPGYPRAGPYHTSDGTHSMLFYPATNLEPCARYTAVITTGVRDEKGGALAGEVRWTFTTRGADGPCPAAQAGSPPGRAGAPGGRPAVRRCLPRRVEVRNGSLAGIRVGARPGEVTSRAGAPGRRRGGTWRWCVRGGGKVIAVFSPQGRVLFTASTARGHRRVRAAPGVSLRRLRRVFGRSGLRRVRGDVYAVRRGRSRGVLFGIRRGRVRYVAAAGRSLLRSPRLLVRYHLRAGFLRPPGR